MRLRGQITPFQTHLESSEHAEARAERPPNRNGSRLLSLDRAQVATTISSSGTSRLDLTYGSSGHWSGSRPFPRELKETILDSSLVKEMQRMVEHEEYRQ